MSGDALRSAARAARSAGGALALLALVVLVALAGIVPAAAQKEPGRTYPAWSDDAQSTTGPVPPAGVEAGGMEGLSPSAATIVPGVPAYLWRHGCGPTAAGMIIGYWDGKGFPDLVPGDASTQTAAADEMIASEGPASNYSDYCLPIDSYPTMKPDLSELPVDDEHADECVADYMHTSQSYHSNYYGWSWYSSVGPAMEGYVLQRLGDEGYVMASANWRMAPYGPLTWSAYRAAIDMGWPMVLLVDTDGNGGTDHFITAVGYDEDGGTQTYIAYNTWDTSLHSYEFRAMGAGKQWGIYGATLFRLARLTFVPLVMRGY